MIIFIKQKRKLFKLIVPKNLKIVYVWNKGLALFANKNFKKNEKVIELKGEIINEKKATNESIQISDKEYIDTNYLVVEDFINHSCSANTKIDLSKKDFLAIKKIKKNQEITINYLASEWDLQKSNLSFKCLCGSKNCIGEIKGFKYLSKKQKCGLTHILLPYLNKKI